MAVPTSFSDLSTTAASNSPSGSETPAEGDNHFRITYAFLRSILDNSGNGWTSPYWALTATGPSISATTVTWSGNPTHSGNHTFSGNVTVQGNTTLGNAGTDTVTTNGNVTINAPSSGNHTISGTAVPGTDATYALGSTSARWTSINASTLVDGANGTLVSSSGTQSRFGAGSAWVSSAWYANNTAYINLTSDGRIYGTAIHNNAGAVTGTTNQYIASGTYTPTGRTGTNTTAVTGDSSTKWMRVGNVVTVGGRASITTSASGATGFSLSLPIASAMTANGNLSGSGKVVSDNAFNVFSDTTNDEIGFNGTMSGGAGTYSVDFIAIYTVL